MASEATSSQKLIQRLLAPERSRSVDTFLILSFSEINLHDTVADIGCGPGFFTVPLAKYVLNGKVYALDINDDMLVACREQVSQARLANVEILKCHEFDFPLKSKSLDGAFLAFVIQGSPDKPRFLQAVRKLLHPKGWCTILEGYRKEDETGTALDQRIDPDELEVLARNAGYRTRGWRDIDGEQYMMMLRTN